MLHGRATNVCPFDYILMRTKYSEGHMLCLWFRYRGNVYTLARRYLFKPNEFFVKYLSAGNQKKKKVNKMDLVTVSITSKIKLDSVKVKIGHYST